MRHRSSFSAGIAAVLLAATAFTVVPASAQMMGGGGPGYGPGMMGQGWGGGQGGQGGGRWGRGMMGGGCGPMSFGEDGQVSSFVDGRIAFLKAELGITDAQTKVWDAFAEAMKSNFVNMRGLRQAMRAAFDADTPVDRLDARISVMESRAATLKEMKQPLSDLYGALSKEQKAKADDLLTGMGCMM